MAAVAAKRHLVPDVPQCQPCEAPREDPTTVSETLLVPVPNAPSGPKTVPWWIGLCDETCSARVAGKALTRLRSACCTRSRSFVKHSPRPGLRPHRPAAVC